MLPQVYVKFGMRICITYAHLLVRVHNQVEFHYFRIY